MRHTELHAIVLAAGESRRLGRPKQLVRYGGLTLIERAVHQAQAGCGDRVRIVLGAHRDQILPVIANLQVQPLINPDWQSGMASSLRVGIDGLPPAAAAVLLILCDHPLVTAAQMEHLAATWKLAPDRAVASAYDGTVGVPAVLPRRLFPELLALRGDRGAKAVLKGETTRSITIAIPEASFDVDTEQRVSELAGQTQRDES